MLAAETGTVIAANMWGKVKTVLQMLTIIFYYFGGALAGPTDVGVVSFVTVGSAGCAARPPCFRAAFTCGRTASCSCRQNNGKTPNETLYVVSQDDPPGAGRPGFCCVCLQSSLCAAPRRILSRRCKAVDMLGSGRNPVDIWLLLLSCAAVLGVFCLYRRARGPSAQS